MQLHSVLSKTCYNGANENDSICRCGMLRTSRLPAWTLIKNPVEPARSEEDLPASPVTEVPLSEIVQTCVQTFIPLAESKNKV